MTLVILDIIGACRIIVGEKEIRSTSPQLFGAALYLAIESPRATTRDELQDLLLTADTPRSTRSHNIRQLLYRLGALGFPIESQGNLVRVDRRRVSPPLSRLESLDRTQRVLPETPLTVLPGYAPVITRAFQEWVDQLRSSIERGVRRMLDADLMALQQARRWDLVPLAARRILGDDPGHLIALRALVDSSFLHGTRSEAMAAIDRFLEDCPDDSASSDEVRAMQRRLAFKARGLPTAPLIGREASLEALSRAWQSAEGGCSQHVLIAGPAGIGKTRIASAIAELVAARGAHTIQYSCAANDRHRPLALFTHISAELLALPGGLGISPDAYALLTRLSRDTRTTDTNASDPISSEILRSQLHDALCDLFDAVTVESRLLLIVDDVHHLDPASWVVLRSLITSVRDRTAMIVLCSRTTTYFNREARLSSCRVLKLNSLTDRESRLLFQACAPHLLHREADLRHAVQLAAGNPYFIHAIARHSQGPFHASIPGDVAELATSSYHALDTDSRLLLESVLLLGDLATIARVRDIAGLEEATFLRSLRLLEEEGLLTLHNLRLHCSHDLLADALLGLIPESVCAVVRQRVAERLERECLEDRFDASLGWAAAEAWLALKNHVAASRLLTRCASQAALLGEHEEAARILSRLLGVPLPQDEYLAVTDAMIRYAEVGGDRSLRARALREQLRLLESGAVATSPPNRDQLTVLRIAAAEADQNEAGDLQSIIAESRAALLDGALDTELRLRAGVNVLIAADATLDAGLADLAWRAIRPLIAHLGPRHTQALRAKLIYHAVFGSRKTAVSTAQRMLSLLDETSLDVPSVIGRRNAIFALHITGESKTFARAALASYNSMLERKVYSEALYVATSLADRAVCRGQLVSAVDWLNRGCAILGRLHQTSHGTVQGYLSIVAYVAMLGHEYAMAATLLEQIPQQFRLAAAPRIRAISAAYRIKLAALQDLEIPSTVSIEQLRDDFEAGAGLGRQDPVVEALWLAYCRRGSCTAASAMLGRYLAEQRRELGPVEWSLWQLTQADPAWKRHRRPQAPMPAEAALPVASIHSIARRVVELRCA